MSTFVISVITNSEINTCSCMWLYRSRSTWAKDHEDKTVTTFKTSSKSSETGTRFKICQNMRTDMSLKDRSGDISKKYHEKCECVAETFIEDLKTKYSLKSLGCFHWLFIVPEDQGICLKVLKAAEKVRKIHQLKCKNFQQTRKGDIKDSSWSSMVKQLII